MTFPTTLLFCLKIILISAGAISIASAIKFSVPSFIAFTFHDLPTVWSSLLTWLKPPYLYFIINGIIITIAASSRFNHHRPSKHSVSDQSSPEPLISVRTPPPSDVVAAVILAQREAELDMNVVKATPPPVAEVYAAEEEHIDESEEADKFSELKRVEVGNDDDWKASEGNFSQPQQMVSPAETLVDFVLPVKEKPLLSSRFGHRKPIKTSPEGGRALKVARPKRQETLESTWKMITEGRHVPLTRHSKKSDTWENHGRQVPVNSIDPGLTPQHVPKSETFKDRTNFDIPNMPPLNFSRIPAKIKKEPSLSQDELNRRVEAFIKKFNEDMRLQRQESLNQYVEMINRGAY